MRKQAAAPGGVQREDWMSGSRRLAIGALLLASCYFETPTHAPGSEDAGDAIDESEAGLADGGMDADTEDADTEPADSGPVCACEGAKPACIVETGTCVECSEARHCTAQAPVCSGNRCVGCTTTTDCSSYTATPACRASDGKCVECTADSFAACKGSTPVCDATSQKCVACNVNADCKEATKPICENHLCRACSSKSDCAPQGKVCRVETGACVACIPDKDAPMQENCSNGKACDPTAFTCTGADRQTISVCSSCISDSECVAGSRCVSTQFKGSPHGNYCLIQQATGICPNRYKAKRSAVSTLGASADYCFPNDSFTTCEGVREFGTACPSNPAECGANDLADDGLCQGGLCTYGCDSDRDCSSSAAGSCFNDVSGSYCKTN
jgi:hypothetical protein